jgi:hypothetical protein
MGAMAGVGARKDSSDAIVALDAGWGDEESCEPDETVALPPQSEAAALGGEPATTAVPLAITAQPPTSNDCDGDALTIAPGAAGADAMITETASSRRQIERRRPSTDALSVEPRPAIHPQPCEAAVALPATTHAPISGVARVNRGLRAPQFPTSRQPLGNVAPSLAAQAVGHVPVVARGSGATTAAEALEPEAHGRAIQPNTVRPAHPPDASNLGVMQGRTVAPASQDRDPLAEIARRLDAAYLAAVGTPEAAQRRGESTAREMYQLFFDGEYAAALVLAESVLAEVPQHPMASVVAAECLAVINRTTLAPRMTTSMDELKSYELDPTAAFVLSMFDGVTPLETIADMCGLPVETVAEMVEQFKQQGIIATTHLR